MCVELDLIQEFESLVDYYYKILVYISEMFTEHMRKICVGEWKNVYALCEKFFSVYVHAIVPLITLHFVTHCSSSVAVAANDDEILCWSFN